MGVLPLHILLLESCCQWWRWRSPKEQFNHSSAGCGCGELEEGEEYWPGWLGEVPEHGSGGKRSQCCHDTLWWKVLLCWECEHQSQDLGYLADESSLNHLAASAPLGPAEGDWGHVSEQSWEHLLQWEVGLTGTNVPWRSALTIHWHSSRYSSIMYSSCHWQGSSLQANTYSPWYTCSTMPKISSSMDPRRVLIEGALGLFLQPCLLIECGGAFVHVFPTLSST